jgi:hypothetical protein
LTRISLSKILRAGEHREDVPARLCVHRRLGARRWLHVPV